MPQLNDTQTLLLSTASQRDTRSLYPLPASLSPKSSLTRAVTGLIAAGLAVEQETTETAAIRRVDGDLSFGVFATDAGLAAIGIEVEGQPAPELAVKPHAVSKISAVLALLQREGGATNADLIAATGWLPHTMRAALTGLRKKGHGIERFKADGVTSYRIVG